MVAEFTPRFSATPSLPPQNVDAEESLLGSILLDPQAIGRIANRLKPEAFYITAHSLIYSAALAIHESGGYCDLMSVTSWLYDQRQLEKVGGQSRLAEILQRTVSSINADHLADLIIDKWIRRQLIEAGNEIIRFGYESFRKLPEIFSEAKERITNLIDSPLLSGEDPDQVAYNKLCLEIQQIELGCADPGMRLWKLQKLAQQYGRSTKQLEAIYFMSLLKEENESLLTWKELSDRYGDQVREWLLHGFLPKGVVIALHAKGGVGKTRLAYDMLHTLLTGGSWNGFPTTGPRRAIVIQTDESAGDMLDALRKRGFDENLDNIRYKTRWTFEHIPQLVKEVQEFNPEVIVMDSITSMSRHSLFSENDVQYARPILKLKDLAQMLGCAIILIHHSSKAGEARGTSAIFNSVSEVWKLERDMEDKSPDSTKRLLTIEKSRSRRPTTYKLDFEPDQGSWSLLGEVGVDENNPDLSTKERIVEFLLRNLGDRFEATEISHEISGSLARVPLCCARLSADGVISQAKPATKGRGKANLYFIGVKSDRSNDRGGLGKMNSIGGGDHFNSLEESSVQLQTDPSVTETAQKKCEGGGEKSDRAIALKLEASNGKINTVIALPDQAKDHLNGQAQSDHLIGTPDQEQGWTKKLFGAVKERESQPPREELPESSENDRGAITFFRKGDLVWWDDDNLAGEYEVESSNGGSARLKGISKPVSISQLTIVRIVEGTGEVFEPAKPNSELTDEDIEDMADSGFDHVPSRPAPYHIRTNPPKKGDRVRSGSGKAGQITLTRTTNPRYEITWEDGRKMGYDFQDIETLDIRRES